MARLFTKNVAKRNSERTSMLGEVCPVVVSKHRFQPVESPSNGGPNYEALKVKRCLTIQEIVALQAHREAVVKGN